MDDGTIRDALCAVAARFAPTPPPDFELVYAPLFSALAPEASDTTYPLALEFVYEGYLSHYRDPRLLTADTALSTRLLAGDHFDASGLRLVARGGDLDAVKLLTKLMASCSWLRAEHRPYAYDDDLWALCVAGIAATASGGHALAALRAFDEVGRLFERDRVERLPDVVRRAAGTLWLRHPAALRRALGLEVAFEEPAAEPASAQPASARQADASAVAARPGQPASAQPAPAQPAPVETEAAR